MFLVVSVVLVIRCVNYLRVEILSYFLLHLYWLAWRAFSECNYVCDMSVCLCMCLIRSSLFLP